MKRRLIIEYPHLPPSENRIRGMQWRRFGGKKKAIIGYTADATAYMRDFQNWVNDNDSLFLDIQRFTSGHHEGAVYRLRILLFFPPQSLLNALWLETWKSDSRPGAKSPHKKGERKAKSPYKKLDSLNRRKLIEDCLATAIGLDDSLNWSGEVTKYVAKEDSKVVLILEEMPPGDYFIPEEYWP
jgi:hypothetical protein